jgi:hypothetical protein
MNDPADRRHFALDTPHWEAFVAALDAPPRQHPRMQRLLRERSDEGEEIRQVIAIANHVKRGEERVFTFEEAMADLEDAQQGAD